MERIIELEDKKLMKKTKKELIDIINLMDGRIQQQNEHIKIIDFLYSERLSKSYKWDGIN